ncbi:ribonuclease BN [Streptococcus gallolyticus]|uniref:Ribonuclease BN n=1 Tax=Streptococcus gallolyticus TaxID=315405 RepID=A0A368UFW8_9STRE|nr:YihY/virulence factor BrkB family protein [Streptococcus gallolyticus]RCW16842.1 ribonuclease BN [Streptococcus gallolyticus]
MNRKQPIDKLVSRLEWQPLQVYLKHYRSAEIDLSAIAVAYYLLLTAFPLIVIAANIFPYLNIDISVLLSFMEKNLPTNLYPSVSVITTDIFSKPSGSILGVATLTAFWTMSKSLTSLQKAINKAYGVSQHRDFVIGRLIGVLASLLILFLLTFVLIFSTFSKAALQIIGAHYDLSDTIATVVLNLSQPVTVLTIVFGLMLLYFILPNVKIRRFRYILPGTIFTSFVIVFLNNLFSNYILRTFERMVNIKTFGSVVIFVLMLWFIFLAHILILGAIFNATYQELRQGKMESRRGDILSILTHRKQDKDIKK